MTNKKSKSCCAPKKKPTNKWEGFLYGLIPHIGCIGFIIGSVLGVTVLMQFFKPLLMNRYFFHFLILISLGFATASATLYLRKHKSLSAKGIKENKSYLSWMYGSTIGINLVLFFLVFPMLANVGSASTAESLNSLGGTEGSTLSLEVDIPCPGHAPLISNELKAIKGVVNVNYNFPNEFEVVYSSETSKEDILGLEVFEEYPATVINSQIAAISATETTAKVASTGASCGSPSCGSATCDGSGSCGSPSCGGY